HNSSRPVSFSLGVLTQMHNALSILPPKRGRPSLHSFSIRDLFLVTLIVAICVAWWLDRSKLEARLKPFSWLEEADCSRVALY
ncbi:MAG: hypothetical protein K8R36_13950, partial [Planctomycetales bacterium]|nr:hypothetical protein [Planctomycetales bacterium]